MKENNYIQNNNKIKILATLLGAIARLCLRSNQLTHTHTKQMHGTPPPLAFEDGTMNAVNEKDVKTR